MRVAQLTGTAYEWLAHYDMAVAQGVPEATLEQLTSWRTNADLDDVEREVLAMTDELTLDLEVADATWAALAERYEPGELVELVLTAAFYSCVSRVAAHVATAGRSHRPPPRAGVGRVLTLPRSRRNLVTLRLKGRSGHPHSRPSQAVVATSWLNRSAGVSHPRVSRGRPLSRAAKWSRSSWL